ncbi:MAG TPA: hypothetical protein VG078_05145 [Acidimicrobiales bacterium]|nr:hypothetical protein [Acidimicrobiales bacterium]
MIGGVPVAVPLRPDAFTARQAVLDFASAFAAAVFAAVTSVLDAVMTRLAAILGLLRGELLEELAATEPGVEATSAPGALDALVGPMVPQPVGPRLVLRRPSLSRQQLAPARRSPVAPPARGGNTPRTAVRGPWLGTFSVASDEPVLSADLVRVEQAAAQPAGGSPAGLRPRVTPAPPDALWLQTALLALAVLLLLGAARHLKSRRHSLRDYYAGYQAR